MQMPENKVAVIMGSDSDWPVLEPCVKRLKGFGITVEAHVMSAHRSPQLASEFAGTAAQKGFGVIIAAAGKAAHLGGVLAAHTTLPVIGVPVKSTSLDGLDALLSTVQMPPGVPVATVGIDAADNAAILAAQILAVGDAALTEKLAAMKQEQLAGVIAKDKKLQALL
jgi:5-(carboxyamino)imidazole ribonucleotide mutase